MLPNKLRSPLGILRITIVVLWLLLLILIIGCVSHYSSRWSTKRENNHLTMNWDGMPPVERIGTFRDNVCELIAKHLKKPCPSISMEKYFVVMHFICFILPLIALIASMIVNLGEGMLKKIDLRYHSISAVLLLIAAIVHLVSANQIKSLTNYIKHGDVNVRLNEKVAAASLTFIQVGFYAVAALLIARS